MFILALSNLVPLNESFGPSNSSLERLFYVQVMIGMAEDEIATLDTLLSELITNPDNPRDDNSIRDGLQINTSIGGFLGFLDYIPDANVIRQQLYAAQAYKTDLSYLAEVHTAISQNSNIASSTPTELALEALLTDLILNQYPPIDDDPNRPGNQILTSDGGFLDYVPDANLIRQQLHDSYARISSAPPPPPSLPPPSLPPPSSDNSIPPPSGGFTGLRGLDSLIGVNPNNSIDDLPNREGSQILTGDGGFIDYVPDSNATSTNRLSEISSNIFNADSEIRTLESLLSEFIANPDAPRDDNSIRSGHQVNTENGGFLDYIPDSYAIQYQINTAKAYKDQLLYLASIHTAISQNSNISQDITPDEMALEAVLTNLILRRNNPIDDLPFRDGLQIRTGNGSTSMDYVPDLNLIRQQLYGSYFARMSSGDSNGGTFPGGGSTDGTFPGGGSTDGTFPGGGSTDGTFPGGGATDGTFPLIWPIKTEGDPLPLADVNEDVNNLQKAPEDTKDVVKKNHIKKNVIQKKTKTGTELRAKIKNK